MQKKTWYVGMPLGLMAASMTKSAMANVMVQVQSESVTSSQISTTTGFFDVFIDVNGTGNGNLQLWQTQVILSTGAGQPTGLSFNSPSTTTGPIVTDQNSGPNSPSRPMALGTDSGFTPHNGVDQDTSTAQSATQNIAGSVLLDGEDGFGFMRVPFTLAPGTEGVFHITLDTDEGTGTVLVDSGDNVVPYTAINGTITVVPEPNVSSLFVLGSSGLLLKRRRAQLKPDLT